MEKLIELLNEYEEDKIKNSEGLDVMYIWKYEGTLHYYDNYKDENVFDNVRFLIISKEYGFIQRLIENNKIDRTYRKDLKYPYYIDDKERDLKGYEKSDLLVMLCSIQDNPIEFLISILK